MFVVPFVMAVIVFAVAAALPAEKFQINMNPGSKSFSASMALLVSGLVVAVLGGWFAVLAALIVGGVMNIQFTSTYHQFVEPELARRKAAAEPPHDDEEATYPGETFHPMDSLGPQLDAELSRRQSESQAGEDMRWR